jgi:uncharacterized protein (DUF1501 family)
MDIWQTANPAGGTGTGWLGRWLDATGHDPMRAISLGATLPLLLRGDNASATAISAAKITLPGDPIYQDAFTALQGSGMDRPGLAGLVASSGMNLLSVKGQLDRLNVPVPAAGRATTDLGAQMDLVAALIHAGAPTRVYQVSLSSFDNHSDEKANHERLLADLDTAVTRFLNSIAATPAGRKTVVMSFSEFGRRLAENASGGTDHGAAGPLFVAGHELKGGKFYGEEPSLTSLDDNGNLRFNIDFRSVYATMLERVLGVDSTSVLGGRFATIPLL